MPRPPLWTAIRDTLSTEIAEGHYPAGSQLPTEAALSERFGVNRHTVRRALSDLAQNGTVHARRGAGVFVQHRPTTYPIGRRTRFHQNLIAGGHVPAKRILAQSTRPADAREAQALQITEGAQVHAHEGLTLSDGAPMSLFRSVFPADRFPDMLAELARSLSVTEAFRAHGLLDYTRARTEITAKSASSTLAMHLQLSPGTPILRTVAVNVDETGVPVEYGRAWFAGDRVTLTLQDDADRMVPQNL